MNAIVKPMRAATADDLPALIDLARRHHAEAYADLPFDGGHLEAQFLARTIDTMDGISLVMERDGAIVGFLAAVVTLLFMAPVRLGAELAFYVLPEHRGHGMALVDDFEAWARWKDCVLSSLSTPEFPDQRVAAAMMRLYRRRGYAPFEHGYLKHL
jgi:GNAT superfamily N-acetyltransferase